MASVGRGSEPGLEPVAAPALDERIGLFAIGDISSVPFRLERVNGHFTVSNYPFSLNVVLPVPRCRETPNPFV